VTEAKVEMMQRAWILTLAGGLFTALLSGCATSNGGLCSIFRSDERPPGHVENTIVQPQYLPESNDRRPPGDPGHLQSLNKNTEFDWQLSEPPAGQRVPELMNPPQVLPPRTPPEPTDPVVPQPPGLEPTVSQAFGPALPRDLDENQEPVVRALACLLANRPVEAVKILLKCPAANQEALMRLLSIAAVLKDKSIDTLSPGDAATLQEQVQGLLLILRSRSDLVIDKMCLCERIDGYGQYTPKREGYAFKGGTGRQAGELVNVYIELRNMTSQLRERYYTTVLNGTVWVRDSQGALVWSYNYRKREQPLQSLMPRSDCYRSYDFFVPSMPPGKYTLTIEVVDETCQPHRVAQKSVEFNVAAP
jgi:hypothetical protein